MSAQIVDKQGSVEEVDISRLESLGVTVRHLQIICEEGTTLTLRRLQDFIHDFADWIIWYKEDSHEINVPDVFMDMARKISTGYDPLIGIKTLRDRLDASVKERMRVAKEKREDSIQAILDTQFERWLNGLSNKQRQKLLAEQFLLLHPDLSLSPFSEASKIWIAKKYL